MFPFVRLALHLIQLRKAAPLGLCDEHVSDHICMPWDIDLFLELNNGRALTLLDIGRLGLAKRAGLVAVLRREGWGLTMAGSSVRYRRRVRMFERVRVRSRAVCWDDKFIYLEQSMWKRDGDCANHVLYRSAVTDRRGLLPPERVLEALGQDAVSPPMPDWIARWCAAEATRPWPPMQDAVVS